MSPGCFSHMAEVKAQSEASSRCIFIDRGSNADEKERPEI
jgi:hypothetical protein